MLAHARRFCSQIWGRGATQLRPWELASLPPPPAHDKTPRPAAASRGAMLQVLEGHRGHRPSVVPEEHDAGASAMPLATDGYRDTWAPPPPPPPAPDRPASARAKVFGPERVVLDPRIRAVHRRVVRDLLLAGFVSGSLLTVVVVALPCGR